MFGFSRRSSSAIPTLDSIGFDTVGHEPRGEPVPGHQRVWWTPDGDGLGCYLFRLPPDLPRARSLADLRAHYEAMMRPAGGTVLDVALTRFDDCGAVQTIAKLPQAQSGFTYVGSVTIPFRAFSFVLKIQAEERGPTGLREAVLLDRQLAAGSSAPLVPDDERFDAEFPQHPASRVRRTLAHVLRTARADATVKAAPAFGLPLR